MKLEQKYFKTIEMINNNPIRKDDSSSVNSETSTLESKDNDDII